MRQLRVIVTHSAARFAHPEGDRSTPGIKSRLRERRGGDILTWNLAADLVFGPLSRTGDDNINLLRFMFLDPDVRTRFVEWEHHAWRSVAQFRLEYDRQPASEQNKALVDEPSGSIH